LCNALDFIITFVFELRRTMAKCGFEEKSRLLRELIKALGLSAHGLVARYEGARFCDGFSKLKVFAEILLGKVSEETCRYLGSRLGGKGLGHHRDGRSPVEYGIDLVRGWLYEDALIGGFGLHGMNAERVGRDHLREFLPGSKVGSDSDFLVSRGSMTRRVEVVSDYTKYWESNDRVDLRDSKYQKLVDEDCLLLGISLGTLDGFLFHPRTETRFKVVRIPRHGGFRGKPAVSVFGVSDITVPVPELLSSLAAEITPPVPVEVMP